MWNLILIIVLAALVGGFVWMAYAVCRFDVQQKILPEARWKRLPVGAAVVFAVMLVLYVAMDFINMVMCFLHLLVF